MKKTSLNIPDNIFQILKNLKQDRNINVTAFIVSAIKEKLAREKLL